MEINLIWFELFDLNIEPDSDIPDSGFTHEPFQIVMTHWNLFCIQFCCCFRMKACLSNLLKYSEARKLLIY